MQLAVRKAKDNKKGPLHELKDDPAATRAVIKSRRHCVRLRALNEKLFPSLC
jgi:hypothetical protein